MRATIASIAALDVAFIPSCPSGVKAAMLDARSAGWQTSTSTRIGAMPLVRLRGPLKRLADDRAEHAIDGSSVGELLRELEREHPATCGWILDERGVLRRHINVFVNGELGECETPVDADDRVDVLPALSGGAR
jgi:molybdopterin synthase sulfur carrier subunit